MPTDSDFEGFCEGLARLDLTEVGNAVALLWYLTARGDVAEITVGALADLLHDSALTSRVNTARLRSKLRAHKDVVAGKTPDSFRIRLARRSDLAREFEPLCKRPLPKVEDHIFVAADFLKTRGYIESLVVQINGSYQFGFYDSCIVLCRRLIEVLLIEAFEASGHGAAIRTHNGYLALSDIIGVARSGKYIKLAKPTGAALEEIKEAGDTGAHSRTYITKPKDIDDLRLKLRRVVSELMTLAGLA